MLMIRPNRAARIAGQQSLRELQRGTDIQVHYLRENVWVNCADRLVLGEPYIVDNPEHIRTSGQIACEGLGLIPVPQIGFNENSGEILGRSTRDTGNGPTVFRQCVRRRTTDPLRCTSDDNELFQKCLAL